MPLLLLEGQGRLTDIEWTLSFFTIVSFLIFLGILSKFAWGPLLKAIDEREKSIRDALDNSQKSNAEALALLAQHKDLVRQIGAERVVKGMAGVKGVANDIEVHLLGASERSDTDIATAAVNALRWHADVPDEAIKVAVTNGWVTLEGQVNWQFQRKRAPLPFLSRWLCCGGREAISLSKQGRCR